MYVAAGYNLNTQGVGSREWVLIATARLGRYVLKICPTLAHFPSVGLVTTLPNPFARRVSCLGPLLLVSQSEHTREKVLEISFTDL